MCVIVLYSVEQCLIFYFLLDFVPLRQKGGESRKFFAFVFVRGRGFNLVIILGHIMFDIGLFLFVHFFGINLFDPGNS